jgi:hypothetical protein
LQFKGSHLIRRARGQPEWLAAIRNPAHLPHQRFRTGKNHAALAARAMMLAEHGRKRRQSPQTPRPYAAIDTRAVRLRTVFHHRNAVPPGKRHDAGHIRRLAPNVRHHNRTRQGRQHRLDLAGARVCIPTGNRIGHHGNAVQQRHRHHPAGIGDRRHHDLAKRLRIQRPQRDIQAHSCRN